MQKGDTLGGRHPPSNDRIRTLRRRVIAASERPLFRLRPCVAPFGCKRFYDGAGGAGSGASVFPAC